MLTTHGESRGADSESFRSGIICQSGGKLTNLCHQGSCYGWNKSCSFVRRQYSEPRNVQTSRLQSDLNDHVKIGPVTGIDVSKSAGTLVIAVQVPSQQTGNSKSWVRISRGIEQYEGQFIPTQTDRPNLEAASSQQSISWSLVTNPSKSKT